MQSLIHAAPAATTTVPALPKAPASAALETPADDLSAVTTPAAKTSRTMQTPGAETAGAGLAVASSFVLTLSCPQRAGIVHAVTSFLLERGFDIREHQQFDDRLNGSLFLRTAFGAAASEAPAPDGSRPGALVTGVSVAGLREAFGPVAAEFGMDFRLESSAAPNILVMVSRYGHCLNDLIFRARAGSLGAQIAAVVSNHEDLRPMAEAAGLPFHYVPATAATRDTAEARLLELIGTYRVELVVLARYMQILSPGLCRLLEGRAINIHHSFLPGFKGARPYHQAYARGVKQVGATAHYVTPDLDEGPIIEQEVTRVDHGDGPDQLAAIGRDAEARALSRAVRWHAEHRILRQGTSTVVFA